MENKLVCCDCKHPISIENPEGPLLSSEEAMDFQEEALIDETTLKADRILQLATSPDGLTQVMCATCLTNLDTALQKNIEAAEGEVALYEEQYQTLLKQIQEESKDDTPPEEVEQLESELQQLKIEERAHQAELVALQKELHDSLQRETQFWRRENELELKVLNFEEDHAEVTQRIKVAEEELALLKRTSVLNDIFYIDSYDQFGTINGLRLGRLDSELVPWEEINAAWGQCVLLLSTMMKRINYQSARYILYPMGSFSRLAEIHDTTNKYELYGSDANFARLYSRFNTAQVFFLGCLQEFAMYVETQSSSQLFLPYHINEGVIGTLSIKFDINGKDSWTKALRYMLQTMKTLLLWCVKNSSV